MSSLDKDIKILRRAIDLARLSRRRRFLAFDNLTASFSGSAQSDPLGFLSHLSQWLTDRHGTLTESGRRHYIQLVIGPKISVWNAVPFDGGFSHSKEAEFDIDSAYSLYAGKVVKPGAPADTAEPRANSVGAYMAFEVSGQSQPIYRRLGRRAGELAWFKSGTTVTVGSRKFLDEMVVSSQRSEYATLISVLSQKPGILYLYPDTDNYRRYVLFIGSSGLLENYGSNLNLPAKNRSHMRNRTALHNTRKAFEAWQAAYIGLVERTETIRQLHNLGPPPDPYIFPMPAGAADFQRADINDAMRSSNFQAWKAVSDQIDKLQNRHSAGSFFFKASFEAAASPDMPIKPTAKVTTNIEIDRNGVITKTDRTLEHSVGGTYGIGNIDSKKIGRDMKLDLKLEENVETGEHTMAVEYGVEGILTHEAKSDGSFTLKGRDGIYATWAPRSASGGFGICKKGQEVVSGKWFKNFNEAAPDKLKAVLEGKLCVGLHFVLQGESALQAWLVSAPGFFERRLVDDLMKRLWPSLENFEQQQLTALGWSQETWDRRNPNDFPKSAKTAYIDLAPGEKSAAVRLGFSQDGWLSHWAKMIVEAKNREVVVPAGR
jgi:hypothetical protein